MFHPFVREPRLHTVTELHNRNACRCSTRSLYFSVLLQPPVPLFKGLTWATTLRNRLPGWGALNCYAAVVALPLDSRPATSYLMFISPNVSGIAEVGAFENRQLKYSTKADRSTNVDILPSAPILAIPC